VPAATKHELLMLIDRAVADSWDHHTLMIQDILAEPAWADRLTAEDKRGLNPLFTSNMTPYGEVKLNMTSRLDLSDPTPSPPETEALAV